MQIRSFPIALLLAAAAPLHAQSGAGRAQVISHDSSSILLAAPAGWVMDPESGKHDGPEVVFYRAGESWQNGTAVMYAHALAFTAPGLADAIAVDEEDFRSRAPDMRIAPGEPLRLAGTMTAQVRTFASASLGDYEVVAYVPDPRRVWVIVLTARSQAAYDQAYPDWVRLVRSYASGAPATSP
jgi:hypothetical protein